ncbi:MAG: hypothetical protein DRJ66_04670 [Thermoprotei archaeon]|nr:MAG: hypothetical protein DRJ66_04670 [Thermoprotei archaeon]
MCYERALSAIYLEEADRIAQMEVIHHTEFVAKISGIDPKRNPSEALRRTYDRLDLDMIWFTHDFIHPWHIAKKMGERFITTPHSWSKFLPTIWRVTYTINSVEDVLEFNPFEVVDIPSVDELAEYFNQVHDKAQSLFKNQLVPGGTYLTCFMWPLMLFGLKWVVKAAFYDPRRFKRLIDRFAQISLLQFRAWAKTDIKVFISHDDICSTQGPFFSPRWFKQYIFPWYERLWKELKSKGIVVLFCSDGNITPIIDEVAKAGADGFIIEECCDLEYIAERYGNDKVIIGGVDIGVITYGSIMDVINEVKRCIRVAGPYPGYFINISGSIPDNVPLSNLEVYFRACKRYGLRIRHSAPP